MKIKNIILVMMIMVSVFMISDKKVLANESSEVQVTLNANGEEPKTYTISLPLMYERVPFIKNDNTEHYYMSVSEVRPCMYKEPDSDWYWYKSYNQIPWIYRIGIGGYGIVDGKQVDFVSIHGGHIRDCTIPMFNSLESANYYINTGKIDNVNNVTLPDGYFVDGNGNLINSENAPYKYNKLIPTPSKVTLKFILPKLFEKIESRVSLSWQPPQDEKLRVEVSLKYNYLSGGEKITKLMQYITYKDAIMGSQGNITKWIETDLMAYIHDKNTATQGQTFANGKLNITEYYIRYSKYNSSTNTNDYGNWVKIDAVTGGTLDDGKVENTYDEVVIDDEGKETKITDGEYGDGVVRDNDGNVVANPKGFTSFGDYLTAIPNIIATTFNSITTLVGSIGNFGQIFSSMFSGMPSQFTAIILSGVGLMIILGIIKFLKG